MYTPDRETARFIISYMNESQPEALADIATMYHSGVTGAELTEITGAGFALRVRTEIGETLHRFTWPEPLSRREDIREHLQTLQLQATLGSGPAAHERDSSIYAWQDLSPHLPASRGWIHADIAVGDDGTAYIAHPDGGAIVAVTEGGRSHTIPAPFTPYSLARTTDPDLLLIATPGRHAPDDAWQHDDATGTPGRVALMRITDGAVVQELTDPTPAGAPAWRPTSVAIDDSATGSGDIWVADGYGASLVHRFSTDGELLATFDGTATGTAFDRPYGLVLRERDGRFEIVIADQKNHRLVAVERDGDLLEVFGTEHLDSPSSLAELDGHLFVSELNGDIVRFDDRNRFAGPLDAARLRALAETEGQNRPDAGDRPQLGTEHITRRFHSAPGIAAFEDDLFLTEWQFSGELVRVTPAFATHE